MKTTKNPLVYLLAILLALTSASVWAETETRSSDARTADLELPEGVRAPQVVRLMRMSDDELASLRKAVEFVESLEDEQRQEMRRAIGEMRRSEARSREAARDGTGEQRGQLREEWQTFREEYEKDGESLRDLPPAERRALFRQHLREQRQEGRREAAREDRRGGEQEQRSRGNPRGGPRQAE